MPAKKARTRRRKSPQGGNLRQVERSIADLRQSVQEARRAAFSIRTPGRLGPAVYSREDAKKLRKSCWWCGDYACDSAGSGSWIVGNTYRICDPDWSTCPATLTLADGSKWTFSSNCKCDG